MKLQPLRNFQAEHDAILEGLIALHRRNEPPGENDNHQEQIEAPHEDLDNDDIDQRGGADDENQDQPFERVTTVYQDNTIEMVIHSAAHRQERRFSLQDHLYDIKAVIHDDAREKPLLVSLLAAFRATIIAVLAALVDFYGRESGKQCWMTISHRRFTNILMLGFHIT
jgi:hypothetical protein